MENSEKMLKKNLLGSVPAGLSARFMRARAELHPLLFTGTDVGGQAATTRS
jgi:thioredoxin reductase